MSESKEKPVTISPGLYRILPEDPLDYKRRGPGEDVGIPVEPPPPVYATAPEETKYPITLQSENKGHERQIWQVKVVDEANYIYTIERADLVWLPPEYPPTFGIFGELEDRKPISCMEGAAENPHKWMILHVPPNKPWLQQSKFAIFPVPKAGQLPKYFVDDGAAKKKQVEVQAEALGPPEGMILRTVEGSEVIQAWYFESIMHTQDGGQ